MKIAVVGSGRWGSFIAWYLSGLEKEATIYGRPVSEQFSRLRQTHTNGLITFSDAILFRNDLKQALEGAEIVVTSVPSQNLRRLIQQLSQLSIAGKAVVLYMKGIEALTGKRLTGMARGSLPPETGLAI